MKKCVIFRKHAIEKTLINQFVIDIEGCDKHEIEAFVKNFNLICLKTNFLKFFRFKVIQNIFGINLFLRSNNFEKGSCISGGM
jgi:galactitol-specific phosphotransferase system IIB component